jgi:hypothetical protein
MHACMLAVSWLLYNIMALCMSPSLSSMAQIEMCIDTYICNCCIDTYICDCSIDTYIFDCYINTYICECCIDTYIRDC